MASRKRGNSVASSTLALRQKATTAKSTQPMMPKSDHVGDPFLASFLVPLFDAAEFLNNTLPPLRGVGAPSAASATTKAPVSLTDASNEVQALVTQLNSHTTRLSTTLTQLTDDILRSGSRLAYEVELLRGETLSFSETLDETLQDEFKKFVPEGVDSTTVLLPRPTASLETAPPPSATDLKDPDFNGDSLKLNPNDPECIRQLQTLTTVRSRLDSVIQTFGDAMEFVFPPSELSVTSSFLSVSAPEPGSDDQSSEERGQQVLKKLRQEISDLLDDKEDPVTGVEKAALRIEQLKDLNTVWKGTAEEKGRAKFIESLAAMVEERHEQLLREAETKAAAEKAARGTSSRAAAAPTQESAPVSGYAGFMSQFQKIREAVKQ
ncbi:hypothetical protein BROUX41_001128 [Berkeleyomyces rouxiae]|uniref:uncharacterized protein n=1 Tax=Berkeleyomyces rouxiae TaxID=2035830 RepID=UPI003B81CEC6